MAVKWMKKEKMVPKRYYKVYATWHVLCPECDTVHYWEKGDENEIKDSTCPVCGASLVK